MLRAVELERLNIVQEFERIKNLHMAANLREVFCDIDMAAEQLDSALSDLYQRSFVADWHGHARWIPDYLRMQ